MKRQRYFPRTQAERPIWFTVFANQLLDANGTLAFPDAEVAAAIADARWLAYVTGAWIGMLRSFAPSCTAVVRAAMEGTGEEAMTLPTFTPAPLPAGVVPVPPGAYTRLQQFVQRIKVSKNYTTGIGRQLGIVGSEDATEHPMPTFRLRVERGQAWERVRIDFEKYGRKGVVVQGRRGGGDWETLAIDLESPYLDERPLLTPAQPEMRDYRLQFYEDDAPSGELTAVATVTVSP